jgi:hypothetical protein
MVCPACDCTLIGSKITDRNGASFMAWECPGILSHTRVSRQRALPQWTPTYYLAHSCAALVAVVTMLLSL